MLRYPKSAFPGISRDITLSLQFLLWLCLLSAAAHAEFGLVFFVVSGLAAVWTNLGSRRRRRKGEASAYSVFNEDFKSIDGTLTAEMFEKEIR